MTDLGFSKLRDMNTVDLEVVTKNLWNWFGNHGCFIGGIPFTETYTSAGLIDPDLTPFEKLYFVHQGRFATPLIAVRMKNRRASNKGKLHDPMEYLPTEYDPLGVTIYSLYSKKWCPEPEDTILESTFLEKYPNKICLVPL